MAKYDDEFADWTMPEPSRPRNASLNTEQFPAPKKKAPSKAERDAARQATRRSEAGRIGAMSGVRKRWEQSPEGQARTKDITDLVTEHHNALAAQHPDKLSPIEHTGMSHAQVYQALNVHNEGHGHGDQQLPGFENPQAAPQPPRWEDLGEEHKAKVQRNLAMQGTSVEKMSRDFGAQLDQSVWRAHMAGHHRESTGEPVPFTKHFYDDHPSDAPEPLDRPRDVMRESRAYVEQKTGERVDPAVHTAVVSHVSPNVKFTAGERGARTSPNVEAAEAVFQQHAEGTAPRNMTSGKNRRGITNQSRPANARRAGLMLEQHDQGVPIGQARNAPSASKPEGSTQWGPKTGPFVNSFDPHHPDFLVGDVHTAGGGMFPHLGTTKAVYNDTHPETGQKMTPTQMKDEGIQILRKKSAREEAIERSGTAIPGSDGKKVTFHSAADYAARQAIGARGLGTSVRQPQAMQWGEEQIQRKEKSPRLDVPSHADAYPVNVRHTNPDQFRLFD